jgi:hypothetical protein
MILTAVTKISGTATRMNSENTGIGGTISTRAVELFRGVAGNIIFELALDGLIEEGVGHGMPCPYGYGNLT